MIPGIRHGRVRCFASVAGVMPSSERLPGNARVSRECGQPKSQLSNKFQSLRQYIVLELYCLYYCWCFVLFFNLVVKKSEPAVRQRLDSVFVQLRCLICNQF